MSHPAHRTAAVGSGRYVESRRRAYQHVVQGAWRDAEVALTALAPDSRFALEDWLALATTRHQLNLSEGALAAAEQALALDAHNLKAAHLATMSLMAQNRWAQALTLFERHPTGAAREHFHFVVNHGVTLAKLRRAQDAVAVFLEAMVLQMADPAVHMHLGLALKDLKLYQESAESFLTAHTLDPERFTAQVMVLHMRQYACRWDGFDEACAGIVASMARMAGNAQAKGEGAVWSLAALPHPPLLMKAAARQVAMKYTLGSQPLPRRKVSSEPGRRIRVGYVSSDFHNHATALLLVQVLESRNRADFEVTLYSHSPNDGSAVQRRIRSACERFVDMNTMSERQMAQAIHGDGIDILVDLKGQTFGNRLGVFALRPAPIQVTWLGFPGTSGADYIDYIIGDRHVTPLAFADHYSERIAQMPHSYQPNDDQRQRPAPTGRARWGLPDGALVLGNFNQSFKLTPQTFESWMRILHAVPESLLWLLEDNPQATQNLRQAALAAGIAPERLHFAPRVPMEQHLARLPAADLMLDNWPCNAHTTASDALWMGVPIVTMMGEGFAARVAGSLLHAVDLGALACTSVPQYEAVTIDLLRQPQRLQALRRHLDEGRDRFPLFDGRRCASDLEALYRRMVDLARRGEAPQPLPAAHSSEAQP
jgi:predicted O-linked N-acetylglucosamine transferase (SPINDLY family)